MADEQTLHAILEKVGNLNGMMESALTGLRNVSNEQHEIKKSIDDLKLKVESTAEKSTINSEQIKNNKETFEKFETEVKEKFVRVYDAMEKKDALVEDKVSMSNKLWALSAILSFLVAAGFAYYAKIK